MRIPYDTSAAFGRQFIELSPEVVAAILLTLSEGWQYACVAADVNADAGEVLMTERLRDGMRAALKSSPLNIVVLPGTESRSKSGVLLPDGRTDIPLVIIPIFLLSQEHDPHAIIECKRIAGSDKRLCREYIVEGVDRFASGKYGANHAVGFMAGYVIAGTGKEAAGGINSYLSRVSRVADRLAPAAIIDSETWHSRHARAKPSNPVDVHHAFLTVGGRQEA